MIKFLVIPNDTAPGKKHEFLHYEQRVKRNKELALPLNTLLDLGTAWWAKLRWDTGMTLSKERDGCIVQGTS
jgi:hypothetical protein